MSSPVTFILCLLCALATAILCIYARQACTWAGLMDEPDGRKLHSRATPLVGGLALTLIILPLSVVAILQVDVAAYRELLLPFVLATFATALIGMADDRHSLGARDRIMLAMLVFGSVALVIPAFSVRLLSFESLGLLVGLGNQPVAIGFTVLCCVGLVNAVNMADGKNGLVVALCLLWLALLAVRAPAPLLPLFLIPASSLAVLFIFNMKDKVFLGDGGAYGFAALTGLLAILTYNSSGTHIGRSISAEELILLFLVPVADSFRLTFSRVRRGQSPMMGDRDHLHHHLERWLGWPVGLVAYLALALVPIALVWGLH